MFHILPARKIAHLLTVFLFALIAPPCGLAPVDTPTAVSTRPPAPTALPVPTATRVPTAVSAPTIPRPSPTPKPTATPNPEPLLRTASPLCACAFAPTATVTARAPASPVFALVNKEYEGEDWSFQSIPSIESISPSEVQTLVCIRESRTKQGSYTDGQPAYQVKWDVRLVQFKDGTVIGKKVFDGGRPPQIKRGFGAGYGLRPVEQLVGWLGPLVGDRTILPHDGEVYVVAFSPDGKTLVSASHNKDGTQILGKLWDTATGKLIRTLGIRERQTTRNPNSLAFSPDGKVLAVVSTDAAVELWDTATGQRLRTLAVAGPGERAQGVAFSPDGKTLAAGNATGTVMLWDVATGQARMLKGARNKAETAFATVTFSPDGQTLASWVQHDSYVVLCDVATGQELRKPGEQRGFWKSLRGVAFSPDGQTLAAGTSGDINAGGMVELWNVATGQLVRTLEIRSSSRYRDTVSVAFSPDGQTLASGNSEGTIHLWNMATGQLLRTLSGHVDQVSSVAFSPDGQTLVSAGKGGLVKLWDLTKGL